MNNLLIYINKARCPSLLLNYLFTTATKTDKISGKNISVWFYKHDSNLVWRHEYLNIFLNIESLQLQLFRLVHVVRRGRCLLSTCCTWMLTRTWLWARFPTWRWRGVDVLDLDICSRVSVLPTTGSDQC